MKSLIGVLAAIACAVLGTAAIAAPPPGIPDGWSDGYVYSNGARIHYYHAVPQPGKPVIVMVHGITDNGLSWTTLTQDLQKSYDIYMLDARGHGLSDAVTDAATGDTLVDDVVNFVHSMNFTKPILLGHSMGAATVMRLGATYPDLPKAVIMLDPGLPRPPAGPATGAAVVAAAASSARPATAPQPVTASVAPAPAPVRRPGSLSMFGTPELLVTQNNDPFELWVSTCARQNPLWDPVDCQYWALSKKQYHGAYSTKQSAAISGTMSTDGALAKITAPALILKADTTPEGREANLRAASVMKTGKLIHVDGAAHNLHHDKRARTVELLNDFMGRL